MLGKNSVEDPAVGSVPYLEAVVLLGKNSAEDPAEVAVPYLEAVVLLGKNSAEDPAEEAVLKLEAGAKKINQPRVVIQQLFQLSPNFGL
jgi:hypothetical protein